VRFLSSFIVITSTFFLAACTDEAKGRAGLATLKVLNPEHACVLEVEVQLAKWRKWRRDQQMTTPTQAKSFFQQSHALIDSINSTACPTDITMRVGSFKDSLKEVRDTMDERERLGVFSELLGGDVLGKIDNADQALSQLESEITSYNHKHGYAKQS
jgi:hypothetical protein